MSTRCNIILTVGRTKVYLYRHHDGYLAETGADLAEKLSMAWGKPDAHYSAAGAADRFLRSLLEERYERASYEPADSHGRSVYELTDNLHGDIEVYYSICFKRGPVIKYAARPRGAWADGVERWIADNTVSLDLKELVLRVNVERVECNKRLVELKEKNPGSAYANCAPYPMIELEKEVA